MNSHDTEEPVDPFASEAPPELEGVRSGEDLDWSVALTQTGRP